MSFKPSRLIRLKILLLQRVGHSAVPEITTALVPATVPARVPTPDAGRFRHEQRREQETPDERSAQLARVRAHQEERRANLSQQQEEAEQAYRRENQAMQRDGRDVEEDEGPAKTNVPAAEPFAEATHEDFRVSMLSGPNVVAGRYKLPPTTLCPHCNTWKWPAESKKACCSEGAVQLPPLVAAPPRLLQLYGDVPCWRLICAYNQAFAFTSIGTSWSNRSFNEVNKDETVAGQHGVYTYRIQGAMEHYLGSLLPRVGSLTNQPKPAKFAQIYIVDPDMQQRAAGVATPGHLYQKVDDQSVLHQGGRLFQQYGVDQQAKCEQELRWIATHQTELQADQYCVFQDALLSETTVELGEGEALLNEYNRETGTLQHLNQPRRRSRHFLNLNQIGKRVVLPSTHPGSPRHIFKSYQNAMAVVHEFGKPDVFVTMTCSSTWDEMEEKIPDKNQSARDYTDVVARVYQMKLAALLKDLDEDKPLTREITDKLVSAELPDPETNPQLYETILTCIMHGPCGAANPSCACMKDGKCTEGYPKSLAEVTPGNVNGFPVCRRRLRPPGVLKFRGREYDNATINQWVVPYNPYLSQKYNCHINVEVCTTLTAVQYLYKYVYKGSDKAVITIETVRGESRQARTEPNEILRYLNARYVSPIEACMRLLGYVIQGKTHSIVQLTIHLKNAQVVTFRSSDNPDRVLTRGRHTMLTRFFELCASEAPENQIAKTMV
ncbi:unnamed protein product [Phytophthora fragariaefolia]|uniref:Unnamed protein product n=1 Tax=Phytophthora fragariaefolia TaxID=1490495 RepID=A0A9W6Y7K6_9STRA|nr:unnamed protein product [Phytophthora fragariaefolia]